MNAGWVALIESVERTLVVQPATNVGLRRVGLHKPAYQLSGEGIYTHII